MKRRNFFKIVGIGMLLLSNNLFAKKEIVQNNILLYNTDTLFKVVSSKINISYDTYYKHLEYLYYERLISYPRTQAVKVSPDYNLNENHITKRDFEKLKIRRENAIDWDKYNNHSPLTSYIKHKVHITKSTFDEAHSEFGGEDIPSEKERYGESLVHLNLIFSLIQDKTISFYEV